MITIAVDRAYIGDVVILRGYSYRVVGNYVKHGYFLGIREGDRIAHKVYYNEDKSVS